VSWNSGEWSPLLHDRIDLRKFTGAARTLQNAVVTPYGGFDKRKGTEYMHTTRNGDPAHLVPFIYSTTTRYMLELTDGYMRFSNGGVGDQIMDGSTPYEIVTPWTYQQATELHFAQDDDLMYFTHPAIGRHKLTRLTATTFELVEVEDETPPLLEENATTTTITPSGTTGSISLSASDDVFDSGQIGSYFQIKHARDANFVELTAVGTSTTLTVEGPWRFELLIGASSTVDAVVDQRSQDGSSWEKIIDVSSDNQDLSDIVRTGTQDVDREMRIRITAKTGTARAYLENTSSFSKGLVEITAVTDAQNANATVIETLFDTAATPYWLEAAFSDYRGHPRSVGVFDNRLWWAGSDYQPQVFYGSQIDNYENFPIGTLDTDRLRYKLGGITQNAIQWILGQEDLLLGTTGEEYRLGTGDSETTLVPSIVPKRRRQSNRGSDRIQAILVGDVPLFIQRGGLRVRELFYDVSNNLFKSPDLTVLAEHITSGGVTQLAYSQFPYTNLYATTGDGIIATMVYERDDEVAGWNRWVTRSDSIISCQVIPGDGDDEVWMVVKRSINGSDTHYVERVSTLDWTQATEYRYLDCHTVYSGTAASVLTGLDHLEGEEVVVLGDGVLLGDYTVSSGQVDLGTGNEVEDAVIGFKIRTEFKPMKFDIDNVAGNSQGQYKVIKKLEVLLKDSLGPDVYDDKGNRILLKWRDFSDKTNTPLPLYTGVKEASVDGFPSEDPYFTLVSEDPYPMTVTSVVTRYEITESI
jgi:hypothetical protein